MLKLGRGFLKSTEAQLNALGTALLFDRFDPEFKRQILALRISEVRALLRSVAFPENIEIEWNRPLLSGQRRCSSFGSLRSRSRSCSNQSDSGFRIRALTATGEGRRSVVSIARTAVSHFLDGTGRGRSGHRLLFFSSQIGKLDNHYLAFLIAVRLWEFCGYPRGKQGAIDPAGKLPFRRKL
jgi:hypothetical protein